MKLIRIYTVVLLLCGCLLSLHSQAYRFEHITSRDGISQSEVYAFLHDSKGFMWIGTLDGLNKFDGYSIETYNIDRENENSLSNNTIRSLIEDKHGRIWIGTDDGLNVYNPNTETIHRIHVKTSLRRFTVWSMHIDGDFLFLGTTAGLWRASTVSHDIGAVESSLYKVEKSREGLSLDQIFRTITPSKNGGFWVQSYNNIYRLIFQSNIPEPVIIENIGDKLGISNLVNIVEDLSGNLWIASPNIGLFRYGIHTKEITQFNRIGTDFGPASTKCYTLECDKTGNIWIGTLDKGISYINVEELNKEDILFQHIQHMYWSASGLNSNLIFKLYASQNNNLWVGTIGSGINVYSPEQSRFKHYKFNDRTYEFPVSNFVRSVNVDNMNRIWTGIHNNGLFLLDRENDEFRKLGYDTQSVFYIADFNENQKLICASTLKIVELKNGRLSFLDSSMLGGTTFYAEKSRSDVYWYASLNGLVRMGIEDSRIHEERIYSVDTDLAISENNCRVLFYNELDNRLYVGTEGGGLNIVSLDEDHYPIDIQVFTNSSEQHSLSNNYVRSILMDFDKNIWIGTYEGLNLLEEDAVSGEIQFKTFTTEDGLPNNMIQLIIEDEFMHLWIGTNGGLAKFMPEEKKFINYRVSDGLQSNEFSEHAAYKKSDGEIILGGINGINAFYPSEILASSAKPQTTVTDFYLFNKSVKPFEEILKHVPLKKSIVVTDTLVLDPRHKNIGFKFSSMIYPNAEKIKYEYKLDGFDNVWHKTDANNRYAYYTNLRHGKYVFNVRSTNADGIWEESPRQIHLHIQTPFFLTYFAFLIYLVAFILIVIYFSRFTMIRYTTKRKLLLDKLHNEKLHKLDEMRTRFFINISHDLRTPLTLIKGPLENLLKKVRLGPDESEDLRVIQRNVKRLNYLIDQLLDVRKAETGILSARLQMEDIISFTHQEIAHFNYSIKNKGLKLKLNFESEGICFQFDPRMLSMIYFNLISNAIKFTAKGEIKIRIAEVQRNEYNVLDQSPYAEFVLIAIEDDGQGMTPETKERVFERFYQSQDQAGNGYGIGLSHARELILAQEGFIEIESEENVGTKVRFFLPKIVETAAVQSPEAKPLESSIEDIFVEGEIRKEETPSDLPSSAKLILVVEDNADMSNYITKELKENYSIIQAGDGVEGYRLAKERIPDLIISDLIMPNMDGIEFCEKIKSNVKTSHIPLILLTAKVNVETRIKGIETGADDFIPKPFEMDYLKIRVKNILDSREKLRNLFQTNLTLEPSAVTVSSIDENFLSKVIENIEEGMSDPNFTITTLESNMGMSHSNFFRKIKSLTGQSSQELLNNFRMKRAYQVLSENKNVRVSDVAYMVGFNSPKYFSNVFKKIYGIAPSKLNGEE